MDTDTSSPNHHLVPSPREQPMKDDLTMPKRAKKIIGHGVHIIGVEIGAS